MSSAHLNFSKGYTLNMASGSAKQGAHKRRLP
jgi:hypothetical protein